LAPDARGGICRPRARPRGVSRRRRARLSLLQLRRCDVDTMIRPVKLPYEEFDLSGIKTYPLASRKSKARQEDFGRAWDPATGFTGWLASLPNMLAAADVRAVAAAIRRAQAGGRAMVWGLGAHVIKTGLGPILIDLMERGFVSAIALNGAGLIHDFE